MPEQDIRRIFSIWDSLAELARETGRDYYAVTKWNQRGRIPQNAWDDVIAAAKRKNRTLTISDLHRVTRPRKEARVA